MEKEVRGISKECSVLPSVCTFFSPSCFNEKQIGYLHNEIQYSMILSVTSQPFNTIKIKALPQIETDPAKLTRVPPVSEITFFLVN